MACVSRSLCKVKNLCNDEVVTLRHKKKQVQEALNLLFMKREYC